MVDRVLTDAEQEQIATFGALAWPPDDIATALGWPLAEAIAALQAGPVSVLYERGRLMARYATEKKLFDLAKSGDMQAMKKYDQLVSARTARKR